LLCLVLALASASRAAAAEPKLHFEEQAGRITVLVGDKPLATYVWNDPKILRPYLTHVRAPSGVQVTRNHPPIEGRDATDHAEFHPGIWLAFGDLSGEDFWRNKATVRHVTFLQRPAVDDRGAAFTLKNAYVAGDRTVCEEVCRLSFAPLARGYAITWDSSFSGPAEFAFGDQEEMGLGVRLATPLTVKNGGHMLNSDGLEDERGVWGKQADWCDYAGTIEGQPAGLLLMPDPANFRRSWFHARDYGVLVANPFGVKAFTKQAASRVVVKPGETLRLRFGVLAHSGEFDPAAAYREWLQRIATSN
jgi:hypothetical protein